MPFSPLYSARQAPGEADPVTGELTLKIIVPNSKVGHIIGKQGAIVREMREKTGAFIQVSGCPLRGLAQ